MIKLLQLMILILVIAMALQHMTKLHDKLEILYRKRRYITFPAGSNLVITLSFIKPLMIVQPRGFTNLLECDVPFPLPSDTSWLRLENNHFIQRREILTTWEDTLGGNGFDGNACVKRMICDFQRRLLPKGQSLISDLISVILTSDENELDPRYHNFCSNIDGKCTLPLVDYLMFSLADTSDSFN